MSVCAGSGGGQWSVVKGCSRKVEAHLGHVLPEAAPPAGDDRGLAVEAEEVEGVRPGLRPRVLLRVRQSRIPSLALRRRGLRGRPDARLRLLLVGEDASKKLADGALRQRLAELDRFGALVRGEAVLAEGEDLFFREG